MNIAVCLFKYFPYGGLQRDFLQITRELIRRGHQVRVYTGSWEGERPADWDIRLLPVKGYGNHTRNRHFYQLMAAALAADPVELVFGFNKMPGLDVYFCADTCFATKAYQDKGWLYRLTPRCQWSLKFEQAVVGTAAPTEILLLSAVEGEAFQRYYHTPAERLRLIPPGIKRDRVRTPASQAQGDAIRIELDIDPADRVIAFLGSDYTRKGLDRLLWSVSSLPEPVRSTLKIIVIGRDKKLPEFQQLANKLGLAEQLRFVGQRDDVPQLLFAANYLLHPAYLENTGNAILEGVVAGLPVLCTAKCGYAPFIKDHELGLVIPEPFEQATMDRLLLEMLNSDIDWRQRCAEFAESADIYSSPMRIADIVEEVGGRKCR